MNYLKAVLKKDEATKIKELRNLIVLGKKLNKNTTPDKKKLEILLQRQNKSTPKKVEKVTSSKPVTSYKHSVKKVYTSSNKIIVEFNVDITKDDIKFFELKRENVYKDVYDIKGYFKDAKPTKLKINGIDRIAIGQFKPDTLRIVVAHNKNLPTKTKVEKRRLTIYTNGIKTVTKKPVKKVVKKKPVEKKVEAPINSLIDKKNSIRTIYTDENKIIIKFNKEFSKKMVQYSAFKLNGSYNDVFNIEGKYAHTKPTKLKIDGLDRIIVREKDSNTLQIRIMNKKDIRVYYYVKKKELMIKVVGLDKTTATSTKKKATKPVFRFKDKVIVIDAGHGAKDAGAVGPNKRYEKVVTLNISKYLYSMLKQRGYKVYLTRHTDKFIKVSHRTKLANRKKADIFISVHANSVPRSKAKKVQGIETYFLSPARSARAKRVAAKENSSDIRKMSSSTQKSFLESLNRPRITASHKLAIDTQAGMLQAARTLYKDVKDAGVREGPFWVLVGAQMPSILIEVGFISHPVESRRLYSRSYQKLLANGIANGVDSYFSKNP